MTAAVAAGRGDGREERAGLDAVGHDRVRRAVQRATPSIVIASVPAPAMRAPIATRQRARSTTSGSRAAFSSTVVPSASVAAIIRFSVPVTVTMSNTILAPAQAPPVASM